MKKIILYGGLLFSACLERIRYENQGVKVLAKAFYMILAG